jgi:hypothetical protein
LLVSMQPYSFGGALRAADALSTPTRAASTHARMAATDAASTLDDETATTDGDITLSIG